METITPTRTEVNSDLARLNEMKEQAENLWRQILVTRNEEDKRRLRGQYREKYGLYKRQLIAVNEKMDLLGPELSDLPEDSRPPAVRFTDYKDFLKAYFVYLKKEDRLDIAALAKKSRVSLESLAALVKSDTALSAAEFKRLVSNLKINDQERSYLEHLHTIAESESAQERAKAAEKLQELPAYRKQNPVDTEAWRYLTHWYYVVIREMSTLAGFKADAAWIQKRLRRIIPLGEIKKALSFLEKAGFFTINKDGSVKFQIKNMICKGGIFRLALGQFHREMLGLTSETMLDSPSDRRMIVGQTLAMSREKYKQAEQILNEAWAKVAELEAGDSSLDEIYHIGLFAVPVTRSSEVQD